MLPFSLVQLAAASASLSGQFTVADSPQITLWDEGRTVWIDLMQNLAPAQDVPGWPPGPQIARRTTRWDEPSQTIWDGGKTRFYDVAPGWDTIAGSDTRTWVIGPAGPFGVNLYSGTGAPLTARLLTQQNDPRTLAQQSRRSIHAAAVAAWHSDPSTCTQTATTNQPGEYWSPFHRWIAYYHRTH